MLASITPLGERGRNNRFAFTATAYVVGASLGGLTLGALAGGAGQLMGPSSRLASILVVVVALVAVAADVTLGGSRLPSVHRQVNEEWLTAYRGWVYGLGFGFQLGLGVVTVVTAAAVYAVVADAVLTGSLLGGVLVGLAFGFTRGLTVFLGSRVHRTEQLTRLHRSFAARARRATQLTVVLQVVIASGATIAVLGAS